VALCGKVDEPEAERLLSESGWDIPVAIVRAWYQEPLQEARQRLQNAGGNIARLRPRE
jgi:N-acetylmuramic acid 6-phosphate (MurNAc-6-P) etherase